MIGIYLAAFKAEHSNYNIIYQDINGKRDIGGDMMDVDLSPFDFIIATPPCNYYSRANYRRDVSPYALLTKHLLPDILDKLIKLDKPFIVENVCNSSLLPKRYDCINFEIGGHHYWTNQFFDISGVEQIFQNKQNISRAARQGGYNVHNVIDKFCEHCYKHYG